MTHHIVGMGNIWYTLYDYCKAKNITITTIIDLPVFIRIKNCLQMHKSIHKCV